VNFIAEHADRVSVDGLRWGVEPICAVLSDQGTPIALSTYYDVRDRAPSRQALRDEQLKAEISRSTKTATAFMGHAKCGWRSTEKASRWPAAPVERLMRKLGLQGIRRGPTRRTTISDPAATAQLTWFSASFPHASPMPPGWPTSRDDLVRHRLRGLCPGRILPANPGLTRGHEHGH
jgi:putative transposase